MYSFAFSADAQQRFLYVADRRQAGQFMVPHSIGTDSQGNLYVAEIREGRVQKFAAVR